MADPQTLAQKAWWTAYYAKYYGQPNWGVQGSPWLAANQGSRCLAAGGTWTGAQCVDSQGYQYGVAQSVLYQGQPGYAACVRQGYQVYRGTDSTGRVRSYCRVGVPRTTQQQYITPQQYAPTYGYQTPGYAYQTPYYGATAAPSVEPIPEGSEGDTGGGIFDWFGLTGLGEETKDAGKAVLVGLAVAGLAYLAFRKR